MVKIKLRVLSFFLLQNSVNVVLKNSIKFTN